VSRPALSGIKLFKVPVADLRRSIRWWEQVYAARATTEFPNADGSVHCVYLDVPGLNCQVALEPSPEHAAGLSGFNLVDFAVPTRSDLEAWLVHLDRLGVQHTGLFFGTTGWATRFTDPDGLQHQLYTLEQHGQDLTGLPGRGRPIR
jgi:catechol-2,3-dioxygenase